MNKVKLARIRAGLSQYELAERSGITQHTISNLERNKGRPRGRTVGKLAAALGVDVLELLGDVGTSTASARLSPVSPVSPRTKGGTAIPTP